MSWKRGNLIETRFLTAGEFSFVNLVSRFAFAPLHSRNGRVGVSHARTYRITRNNSFVLARAGDTPRLSR